jgi:2-oxoglutarate dehydrogenase E2 component (dihydrolipoamide succinyltransferase)
MSVSVSMPQLGESVTEGTVTRWLKKEGERVEADEPLLEVSTDKVDTEIPSPASGVLRDIAVGEDETVEVGAQLAVIEEGSDAPAGGSGAAGGSPEPAAAPPSSFAAGQQSVPAPSADGGPGETAGNGSAGSQAAPPAPSAPASSPPAQPAPPRPAPPSYQRQGSYGSYGSYGSQQATPPQAPSAPAPSAPQPATASGPGGPASPQGYQQGYQPSQDGQFAASTPLPASGDGPYVTPLVRKLAAEHGVDLESVSGTGVGGRIRKQDVLDAARARREAEATRQAPAPAAQAPAQAPAAPAGGGAARATAPAVPSAPSRPAVVPSALRGTTQRMSRPRQVIAQRMVESLQTSAQLTTVVEADVTAIARLRERAKREFEAREGVKLSFLPFFAIAAVEALKIYPTVNAVIDAANAQVTYHDAEHLGIAVDTERGLMVPVIHNAGDLNLGGLARKIADLAARTRSGQVSPDELSGGTFTLTNTGSRGALFDTPIINQPQVGILGTGTVVKRPVVVDDPALGEVIAVRSMVYLALTYDHRLVDGADAARFLSTVKERLEEGSFEAELGL